MTRSALLLAVARHVLEAPQAGGVLAEQVFAMIREHLGADIIFSYQLEPGGSMRLVGSSGIPEELHEKVARLLPGQAVCGQVAATGEPVVVDADRIASDPATFLIRHAKVRSYACYPLLDRDGQVLGTFSLGSRARTRIEPIDVELIQTISHFLALAWARQRTEEELQAREERHRTILDSITDGFFAIDHEWRFTYVNRVAEDLGGRSREQLLGKSLWEAFPELIGSEFHRGYQKALDENVTVTFEAFYPPLDRWFAVKAYPSPAGLSVYLRDVTQAKRDEQALQQAHERLQIVQRGARLGSFEWDLCSNDVSWSAELEALHGRAAGTFGRSWEAWVAAVHPDDLPRVKEAARKALTGDGEAKAEWRIILPDGAVRWIAGYAKAFRDEAGLPVRMAGIHMDITDRKRAEERLRQRKQEFRTLADNAPAILARFDRQLRHLFVNRAIEPVTGRRFEEFLGKTNRELGMPEELCELWEAGIRSVFETRQRRSIEFRCDTPDGPRHFAGQIVPEFSPGGEVEHVLGVISDRTAEKLAAEALEEADRRKDQFLATLAHELRNPLAPVRSGVQILRRSPGGSPAATRALDMMERQIAHMVRLIDDLLDVARISQDRIELRRERLTLHSVLEHAVEASLPFIEAGRHRLSVQLSPGPIHLDADLNRLSQVVSNLLNNAAKYTPDGGEIIVSAGREGGAAIIRVKDNGAGIAPEMLSKVFEMFTQVGRTLGSSQGGLGIGLAISKRLVEMHGGSIEAESRGSGLGVVFTVRLPLAQEPAAVQGPADVRHSASAPSGEPGGRARRVLVVDDNPDVVDSLATMLGLLGYETRTAFGGPEALEAAREFAPAVIFCDIGMPEMNGYEVAGHIRQDPELARTTLVALTGWGSEEDKRQAQRAGFDFHITKPAQLTALQEILDRVVQETDS